VTAGQLFSADVPDCGGKDVREAAAAARASYRLAPLSPTPAQLARWERGKDTRWPRVPDLASYRPQALWQRGPATRSQLTALARFGMAAHRDLTKGEASHLLEQCNQLDEQYPTPATPKQEYVLKRRGQWRPNISKRAAARLISMIA
jgi:hypothetical protein